MQKLNSKGLARGMMGGVLMGLANLVPGISGGTMLVAAGVYQEFINAIAEITTLRFRLRSMILLGSVGISAGLAILLLAGWVKGLVVDHRWLMYSLFIGLTLGGVPVVWKMIKRPDRATWIGAALGLLGMSVLALFQSSGNAGGGSNEGILMMWLAGVVAAGAMILPGISGGYLFLIMGVYVPILGAIDQLKLALKAGDIGAVMGPGLNVILPVGIGVVIGVAVVSNLLKRLLDRYESGTLGVLLGLLVGAVVGLWPFQQGIAPAIGQSFKGQLVTAELLSKIPPHKYPTQFFQPGFTEIMGALGMILLGIILTLLVARLGKES